MTGDDQGNGRTSDDESATLDSGIPERLKQCRDALDASQASMNDILGLGKRSWQRYESGANFPGGRVLQHLAARGFSVNWILTGAGSMYAQGQDPAQEYMAQENAGVPGAAEARAAYAEPFMSRVRRSTELLQQIRDELDYDPGQPWNSILQEMLVSGQLTESGAYTLMTRLRTMGGEN